MIVRSPSRFALVLFVAVVGVVAVWQRSPWARARAYVYQRVPVAAFAVPKQNPMSIKDGRLNASTTRLEGLLLGGISTLRSEVGVLDVKKADETAAPPPWETLEGKGSRLDYEDVRVGEEKKYMDEMMDWSRPSGVGHWPPFEDYVNKDYDPNRWEEFEYDHRFYTAGHHRLSPHSASNPTPYLPFPAYNSPSWRETWHGTYTPCTGPRGLPLNASADDTVHSYPSIPASFPKVFAGAYDVVGLNGSVCFDRYSRYGAYGFGDDKAPSDVLHWQAPQPVRWEHVDWAALQDACLVRNAGRYAPGARAATVKSRSRTLPDDATVEAAFKMSTGTAGPGEHTEAEGKKFLARTAVLIRAWTGYVYEANDVVAIRAMVSELSLASGGEYEVFLLVHVKDGTLDVFGNATLYEEVVRENVPRELRGIAVLWSESVFPEWYPDVGDWQVYWHQFMCLQWFSLNHPQFDYIWNWETDARYTGHHYDFFTTVSRFAAAQPRKLLWERNKRFYLPSVHGPYPTFISSTHAAILNATAHSPPIWGPRPWPHAIPPQIPLGPTPPTPFAEDNFHWGVSHPADLLTLLPLWDPRHTTWSYRDKIWNYVPSVRPQFTATDPAADAFTHPAFADLDRRAYINTVARFSKTLLHAMHVENRAGRAMQAEMWPSTVALQHGLKAVYAPHPVFADRHWPAPYAAAVFDAAADVDSERGGPLDRVRGAWTERGDSPYNRDREAQFAGWSWYFASRFPRTLYRRWLGWEVARQEEERRMCMPGMLLHPVKGMAEERVKI
ncbi:hypothetical protein P171DRAFT_461508 [Karstenula rhodostoma CBS 690.94]|uniref:Uncharacterized protein n=1 Tax=Karstenula rhodostoma CBS 690.94 TaxID=1392251 RepID=A0A9P4PPB2_9PLEO|nr:hypothetical protein P171DRAFT_461508 [Karstenula rhodostoma CBS 690.94]